MTQDERWRTNYNEVKTFIENNHRNLSKYDLEERRLYTWMKHSRKQMNAGELRPERVEAFKRLLELSEQYKRVNQWK
jgi:hypothetical protein